MNSLKNGSGSGNGKIFALFAPFARLRTRRATAAFSAALLATVMVMAALFFAGCINPEAEDVITPPPPESKLSITPQGKSISPGSNVDFTAKMTDESPVTGVSWKILGTHNDSTTISGGKLTVGQDETAEQFTVIATYNGMLARATVTVAVAPPYFWKGAPVEGAADKKSINAKFGVTLTGTDGVEAAFKELSAFIQKGGLANQPGVIKPGDYIDLEGGLMIAPSAALAGDDSLTEAQRGGISLPAGSGGGLRLIVVGINSFKKEGSSYQVPAANNIDHVVFQFEYLPGEHRMNPQVNNQGTNAGGYAASEMWTYVTGNFLDGLKAAGVPESVLWGPSRVVSKTNDSEATSTLTDLLWLPTTREMGTVGYPAPGEKAENQAQLEYYATKTLIKKKVGDDSAFDYWLASATSYNPHKFCQISNAGEVDTQHADRLLGVAPAFCVQGWIQQ